MTGAPGSVRAIWSLGLVALLAACAGEGGSDVNRTTIDEGQARVEELVLAAMAEVRPGDREFDRATVIGPTPCERDGLVFSTVTRGWDDVGHEEGRAGLEALDRLWSQQGFAVDRGRLGDDVLAELLARTDDGHVLVAVHGIDRGGGPGTFSVQGETACVEPSDR